MTEALQSLRECLPGIEQRLQEAIELHQLAVQLGDRKEAEKYRKLIIGAHKDIDRINELLATYGSAC